jgi:regulator of cell morphogenesis and NO signaling
MSASELISYILIHHHFYTKQHMPLILGHLEKVAFKHGEKFTYMPKVATLFGTFQEEMLLHMQKEERILFPAIKELEKHARDEKNAAVNFIAQPIAVMEAEHEGAGNILAQIRELSNDFTPPVDACTTFRISLMELEEFENNLHQHVHLENNILFPLAEKMTSNDLVK